MRLTLTETLISDLNTLKEKIDEKEKAIKNLIRIRKHRPFNAAEEHQANSLLPYCTAKDYRCITDLNHRIFDYEHKMVTQGYLTLEDREDLEKNSFYLDKREQEFFKIEPNTKTEHHNTIENISHARDIIRTLYTGTNQEDKYQDKTSLNIALKNKYRKGLRFFLEFFLSGSILSLLFSMILGTITPHSMINDDHKYMLLIVNLIFPIFSGYLMGYLLADNEHDNRKKDKNAITSTLKDIGTLYKCYGVQPKESLFIESKDKQIETQSITFSPKEKGLLHHVEHKKTL